MHAPSEDDYSASVEAPTPPEGDASAASSSPPLLNILRSEKSSKRLNQIDKIRSTGVGAHIALPQIVVCGDQSSGKSSVLEGITGIPFPKKDGLCTRFATEIIVRHENGPTRVTASLIPSSTRSDAEKAEFRKFRREMASFDELEGVIEKASGQFGVRGYVPNPNAPAFAHDVLRLEVIGNTGLYLTVVDLPGLISNADNDEDVTIVKSLVESYLENSRTIILAVIQAEQDIETHRIIQLARQHDKDGERTLGIVTKPDLINEGSESRVASLTTDKWTLKLGFFLLKNPAPNQFKNVKSPEQRERLEERYFSSDPWKTQPLDRDRVGVAKLREFSQKLLDSHIERELPKVRKEIRDKRKECLDELGRLGAERSTIGDMRTYVSRICQQFNNLAKEASDGKYNEDFFGKADERKALLLRARIHALNEEFAMSMRLEGKKKDTSSSPVPSVASDDSEDDEDVDSAEGDPYYPPQEMVSETEFATWIKATRRRTRGKELPGNTNHYLLWSLFREQSERWASIANRHLEHVLDLVSNFAMEALSYSVSDTLVRNSLQFLMRERLDNDAKEASSELVKLVEDETHQPITYNHYYTDNVQKKRQDTLKSAIEDAMDGEGIRSTIASALEKAIVENSEKYTCAEAADNLHAYYAVALKTFVDNVCRQVVERHVMRGLTRVLDPTEVSGFSDEYLVEVASETEAVKEKRKVLRALEKSLEGALKDLK